MDPPYAQHKLILDSEVVIKRPTMSRLSHTVFVQTLHNQTIPLPRPISNVTCLKFEMLSATNLTTSGSIFWLTCPEANRTNANYTSIFREEQAAVWMETSPLWTERVNQLEPYWLFIETGNPSSMDIVSFPIHLKSDGAIPPGFSILWRVSWQIAGPDNLLAPY
jgi:hypothetical protein